MSQDHYSLIYTGRKKNRPKTQTKTNKPNTSRYAYKEESFHRFKKKKKEISHIKFLQNPMHIDSIL